MKKIPEIMVDLDSRKETPEQIRKRFRWLAAIFFPGVMWRTYCVPSPSKRGWHFWAYADVDFLTVRNEYMRKTVIFFQLLMGSDAGRERANLRRVLDGVKDWNVLFSTRRVRLNPSLHNVGKKKKNNT